VKPAPVGAFSRAGRLRAHRRATWLTLVGLALACGVAIYAIQRQDSGQGVRPVVFADGATMYPSDTLEDVVRHADGALLVTAVAARESTDPAPPERVDAGELWIYRVITFKVDQILWRRSDASATPEQFDAVWSGWVTHDHQRSKLIVQGSPWVEVGKQYLMPVTRNAEGDIVPDLPEAVFPVTAGLVSPAERQDSALAKRWSSRSLDVVAGELDSAAAATSGK
jgi:hypothetical protein